MRAANSARRVPPSSYRRPKRLTDKGEPRLVNRLAGILRDAPTRVRCTSELPTPTCGSTAGQPYVNDRCQPDWEGQMGVIMTADAAERDRRPIDAWCAAPGGHTPQSARPVPHLDRREDRSNVRCSPPSSGPLVLLGLLTVGSAAYWGWGYLAHPDRGCSRGLQRRPRGDSRRCVRV